MTYRPVDLPSRTVRTVAASAIACGLALGVGLGGWAGPADASESTSQTVPPPAAVPTAAVPTAAGAAAGNDPAATGGSASVSSLQVQAQELAGQIDADGRQLDQLSAAYQAAQMHYRQLSGQEDATRRAVARTDGAVARARTNLRRQALQAYLTGGSPLMSYIPGRPGMDPSLTSAYAEIISAGQRDTLSAYRATLADQRHQVALLDAETRQAGVVLASAQQDAAQAQATLADRRAALAQVTGQLAVAVTAYQTAQRKAEAVAVQARLAAAGQLPPSGPTAPVATGSGTATASGGASAGSPATAGLGAASPGGGPTSPSTVRAAPAPAPVIPAPRSPSPAPTSPPAPAPTRTAPPATAPPASNPPVTNPPAPGPSSSVPPQAPGASQALAYARAQLGKPYQWGGAGPDSFDCSGLVMMAWDQGGVHFDHLAQDQYDMTARIPLAQLLPGDLVFFGTPSDVYHVGIYIGNGQMIDAPETGQDVSVQSIYWDTLLGGGRVHT